MRIALTILILTSAAVAASAQRSLPPLATLEGWVQAGDSLDAEIQFQLALRYEAARRYDDAERALRIAIAADPRSSPSWMWLGDLPYLRDKKLAKQEARHDVPPDRISTVDSAKRFRVRAFTLDPFGQDFATYFDERYDLSFFELDLYLTHQYGKTPLDSVPSELLFYHGLTATQMGRYDKAASDFQVLVKRGAQMEQPDTVLRVPLNANAYRYVLAIVKERSNKPVDAIQLYHDIITHDLGFYMAYAHLSQLYRQYKMWDSATVEAQAAVEANPDDPWLLVDLGAIERDSGHLPDAATTLQKAVELDPRFPEAYYRLGVVLQGLHRVDDARAALTHFVAVAPTRLETEIIDAKKRLDSLH